MAESYVILVNWNGKDDTIECIESLLRLDRSDFAILVIDNGSTNGSIEALKEWSHGTPSAYHGPIWDALPAERRWSADFRMAGMEDIPGPDRITVIPAHQNLGYAAANNIGMRFAARDPEARFFWLLNNDTVVEPGSLSRLVDHVEAHPDVGLLGSTVLYYHAPDIVQGLGGWLEPRRAMGGHIGFGISATDLPRACDVEAQLSYVMGASMFVPVKTYDMTGGMSEAYFLYFEEPDWARRLPAGLRQAVCLDAIVYHKEGSSIGTDSLGRPSDTSLYYFTVNTLRYFWRHERRFAAVAVARVAWNAIGHARRFDAAGVRVTARACLDALTRRRRRGPYGGADFRKAFQESPR